MTFLLTFLVTVAFLEVLRRYAEFFGLVSHPGGHRHHSQPTPLVGGLGVFAGLVAGIWLLPGHQDAYIAAIGAGTVLVVTGVWDDIREASFAIRFFAQALAVALLAWITDVSLLDLGHIFNTEHSMVVGRWGVALTIFAAVGVINAVNMSDGLDGLAGGLALVTCTALLFATQVAGNNHYVPLLGVVMAALTGFMLYNVRIPGLGAARLYLGDAGSLLIGFLLAWLLIAMTQDGNRVMAPVTALWIFALPLFDAVASLLRRPLQGRSPFHADRTHYHHYLRECGFSVNQTLIISILIASALAGTGLVAEQKGIPEYIMFYLFIGLFILYFALMMYLDANMEKLAALCARRKNRGRMESTTTRSV